MTKKCGIVAGILVAAVLLFGEYRHLHHYTELVSSRNGVIPAEDGEDGYVQENGESAYAKENGENEYAEGNEEKECAEGNEEKECAEGNESDEVNIIAPTERPRVYLTFDDGPSELTPEYLDILKKHQAKATFFLIGEQIQGDLKAVVKREIEEGHELGVHTYTHESNEIYQSADSYYQDVNKVRTLLKDEFQYQPSVWRFPWGSANCYICNFKEDIVGRLQKENMNYVDWNVSAEDSVGTPTTTSIMKNIQKDCFRVKEPVILMHDSNANHATLETLEAVVTMLEENGYQFATISEREKECHFGEYN